MEYVEGEPIDEYCDRRQLSIEDRLDLFRSVCLAVHLAHQNLVVHRDLKPGNILVTAGGTPKLLDFGIAKLVDPDLSPASAAATATQMRVLTPEYASPEQIRGGAVTTASDVYSLGVLLYKLLTGCLPHAVGGSSAFELARRVTDEEPTRPSAAVLRPPVRASEGPGTPEPDLAATGLDRRKLHRRLRGDLDNVVLKALRKRPERRYGSAEQLAEDVRNHLRGRPVLAAGDAVTYRFGKLLRRHRLAAAAVTAFMASCLAFGGMMAAQRLQVARERDRALAARAEAEEVTTFLVDLFQSSDPDRALGTVLTARQVLDRGARQVGADLAGQPLVQARLLATLGLAYHKLGLYDEALPLLERATETRRRLLGETDPELGESLRLLGNLHLDLGEYDRGAELLARARTILRQSLGDEHPRVATALRDLAVAESHRDHGPAAEELARQSLVLREQAFGPRHPDIVDSLNLLANFYKDQGRLNEAEPLFQRALAIAGEVHGPFHSKVAAVLNGLGNLYLYQGRTADAEPLFRRALEISERLFGPDHPRVALASAGLANLYKLQGKHPEAEALYIRAQSIFEGSLDPRHPYLGICAHNLAEVYRAQGKLAEAEPLYLQADAILTAALGPEHPHLAANRHGLANLYRDLGRRVRAEELYRSALGLYHRTLGAEHPSLAPLLTDYALLLRATGRSEEAAAVEDRAAGLAPHD